MAVNGLAIGCIAGGFVLFWSGIKNQSPATTIKDLLSGNLSGLKAEGTLFSTATPTIGVSDNSSPTGGDSGTAGDNTSGSSGGSAAENQTIAQGLAVSNGHPSWATGSEWSDWVDLWDRESGWSASATNPSSGAYGIAQALGHGTAGSAGTNHDEYGASYGLTTAEAISANNGNASDQILWGIGYISETYGSPSMAWAHEEQNGWY